MKEQDLSENKSICFVANFYKTFFFHEVAKQLQNQGYIISWIVTKEDQYQFLKEHYNIKNILLINKMHCRIQNQPIEDFKINELIYGDRIFNYTKEKGLIFLTNIQKPTYDFIKANRVSHIIGEKTWAHELLIHRIVSKRRELNCKYYLIATTRIPNGRIIFFEDEKETKIVKPIVNGIITFKENKIILEKPHYLLLNDKILHSANSLMGKLKRIKKYITGENIESNDPNVFAKSIYRFLIPVREEFNRITYKLIKKETVDKIVGQKYILFGFHKQPEASIDVCGRYYENQSENVINLWRQLPPDWKLIIKEHSNAVGDRSYIFYKRLLKYPNIILADEKVDSHLLIKNAQLVATNTGTMGLEAALMGIPAITFSKVFFNMHNYCKNVTWVELEKYTSIINLINEIKGYNDNSIEYANYIIESSFEGAVGDIDSNPDIVNDDIINKVTMAIVNITT
ncbi:MAG: DUF354 domain-containing protein [Paludibacter sp.]|nr:DUF354 domain-containing protein [Paludibacter sp.]